MRRHAQYLGPYWQRRWALLGHALLAAVALACSIGLLVLSGWFLTATALAGMSLVTAQAFNFFTPGALVRLLAMGRTAGRYAERVWGHSLTLQILADLRGAFFRRLIPIFPRVGLHPAELLQRLQQDIDALDHLYLRMLVPLMAAVVLLVPLLLVLYAGLPQAALMLMAVLLLIVLLLRIPYRLGTVQGARVAEAEGRLQQVLHEYLGQLGVLQLFARAPAALAQIAAAERDLFSAQDALARQQSLVRASLVLLPVLLLLLLLSLVVMTELPPFWQGPELACLLFLWLGLQELVLPLADGVLFLGRSRSALERLAAVCQAAPCVFPVSLVEAPEQAVQAPVALECRGLEFAFPEAAPLLREASFCLRRGERLALVGPSGCGKSTLIGLLARWFAPQRGEIELWQRAIETYAEPCLRAQFAVLPQQVDLLDGSLALNLRLAAPGASSERLLEVLRQVELTHLAAQAADLESCCIGAGGRRLSGGERRRIGLARVLLSEAPIWILDEPTEGLDLALEARLLVQLERALAGKTLLLISHRAAPLGLCQRQLQLVEASIRPLQV